MCKTNLSFQLEKLHLPVVVLAASDLGVAKRSGPLTKEDHPLCSCTVFSHMRDVCV